MGKPSLDVNTYVSSHDIAECKEVDYKWDIERKGRLKKEIAFIEKNLKNWNSEEAGNFLKDKLREELISKESQLEEMNKKRKVVKKHKLNFA